MRRVTMVLVAAAVLLALFVPGALARTGCASSYSGDDRPNTLTGDRCDNEINDLGGDDVIRGNGGDDTLSGGKGADQLRGGQGRDRIYSGAFDGRQDFVVCGAGCDFASIGEDDRVAKDCERVAFAIASVVLASYGGRRPQRRRASPSATTTPRPQHKPRPKGPEVALRSWRNDCPS